MAVSGARKARYARRRKKYDERAFLVRQLEIGTRLALAFSTDPAAEG